MFTGAKTPVTKDFLSRSLVMERSPLSEEIRKMFKKAVEDTPPPPETKEKPVCKLSSLFSGCDYGFKC